MPTWNHALQRDMAEDHAVLRQYPELAVNMFCKRCQEGISPVLMCCCLPRVSPVVSLDSVGSTLLAMRAGCRRGSGSSKHLLVLQSRLPLHHARTDVFSRLLPLDVSENNWPSSCPEGVENKPKKPPAEKTAQERCVLFTQRKHTVTCSNNTIVARLLAQHQGGSSNSSQHCWEQCFVHGNGCGVCSCCSTNTHSHHILTAVYQDAASYYRTVKHRGQTTTANRNIQSGHSKHDLVFSIPMNNSAPI